MPLDTILCLDTSGSMTGRGMAELQKAVNVFIDGVEETAIENDLKENVAIVEFGKNTRIVQSLTTNYGLLRLASRRLEAGGPTPMFAGLMLAMQEILTHGGVIRVLGRALTPRIILMTDGKPSDDTGEETQEAKTKVLTAAASFGQGWQKVGLPHPIPIACVGCGTCDPAMLEIIAKLTNGMFVVVDNMSEISGFFRRQVLLIRFATQFASDVESMRNELILRSFLEQLGEAVAEEELRGLMTLLVAMMGLEALAGGAVDSDLPPLGSRVRRGPDWKWGVQDSLGVGTVVEKKPGGVIQVVWDEGNTNSYRFGAEGAHDVKVVDEPRVLGLNDNIKIGVKVIRGPDWQWDDQDGGDGNCGMVYVIQSDGWVKVRWMENEDENLYRFGAQGSYDLHIVSRKSGPLALTWTPRSVSQQSTAQSQCCNLL